MFFDLQGQQRPIEAAHFFSQIFYFLRVQGVKIRQFYFLVRAIVPFGTKKTVFFIEGFPKHIVTNPKTQSFKLWALSGLDLVACKSRFIIFSFSVSKRGNCCEKMSHLGIQNPSKTFNCSRMSLPISWSINIHS